MNFQIQSTTPYLTTEEPAPQAPPVPLLVPQTPTPGVVRATGSIMAALLLAMLLPSIAYGATTIHRLYEVRCEIYATQGTDAQRCRRYVALYDGLARGLSDDARAISDSDTMPAWISPRVCVR